MTTRGYNISVSTIFFVFFSSVAICSWYDNAQWYDDFYQYRIPFEAASTAAGQYILPITESDVVTAINNNANEDVKYDDEFFAFDNVLIVEYDSGGNLIGPVPNSGYVMVEVSSNKITNPGFESGTSGWSISAPGDFSIEAGGSYNGSDCLKLDSTGVDLLGCFQYAIPVTAGEYVMLSFWAKTKVTLKCPDVHMMQNGTNTYITSSDYQQLFSRDWRQHFRLYKPNFTSAKINIYRYSIGESWFDDFSFKEVSIKPVIEVQSTGDKYYMLYYQPSEGSTYNIPSNTLPALPAQTLAGVTVHSGATEKYVDNTMYTLSSDADLDLYFAETTVKVGPSTPAPSNQKPVIDISCAANERQSFQLVLNPKGNVTVDTVTISELVSAGDTISSDSWTYNLLDYVNMTQVSLHGHVLVPKMTDPMVEFAPQTLTSESDNMALWFTVEVDTSHLYEDYAGTIALSGVKGGQPYTLNVPLTLHLYSFKLPEKPSFRSMVGGTVLYLVGLGGTRSAFDYHGVTSSIDKKTLFRKYAKSMAERKGYTQWPNLMVPLSYLYDDPPWGTNVDKPGNFYWLHDFNFTAYNNEIRPLVDDYHQNTFAIHATNGDISHTFHLHNGPTVGWGPWGGYDVEITQSQFVVLIQDYFREVAQNLLDNGWLEYAVILVDETQNAGYQDKLHVFCDALKADPLTAQLKIGPHTVNNTTGFSYRVDPSAPDAYYKGKIDIWAPENGQVWSGVADYYFPDMNMGPDDFESWRYYTRSAHLIIDTKGVTNRNLPMKNYFMGGVVSYYYPPLKTGPSPTPNFTITPSLRMETWREGVEDFEYVTILRQVMTDAAVSGIDTASAQAVIDDFERMFHDQVHWSVNDEFYLKQRDMVAQKIEELIGAIVGQEEVNITVSIEGVNARIDFDGKAGRKYVLKRAVDLVNPAWTALQTVDPVSDGPVTLYDLNALTIYPQSFYKLFTLHKGYQ